MKLYLFLLSILLAFCPHSLASKSELGKRYTSEFPSDPPQSTLKLSSKEEQEAPPKPLVLVTEDNEIERKIIRRFLEGKYTVMEAKNGFEAVTACKENTFLFITMDILMPVMKGDEAIKVIRNDLKLRTPILVVSSEPDNPEEVFSEIGANAYHKKPVTRESLLEAVDRALLATLNEY